jgi:AGCS family alanine or glycine:cation symporter
MISNDVSILETASYLLETFDNILWGYAVLPILLMVGFYLTFKSGFVQIRNFPRILESFYYALTSKHTGTGVHPLKAFFACIGGCMGIGNVVAVCTAAQIGGPGALFWVWVTALFGMILKYSEVYLGILYRIKHGKGKGGYRGGPMYFLQKVYKRSWIPKLACLLLCIYGVEVYQFSVVTESIATNLGASNLEKYVIAIVLISLIIAISRRGLNSVGRIASFFIPSFIICYLFMGAWVFILNYEMLPSLLGTVMSSAFTGHAAIGGFAGSTILIAASQGMRRSCYAGDIAIGYASVIHSETREISPEKQASLAILEVFIDSFVICTTSVMLVLITGVWNSNVEASMLVQNALANYFPGMHIFMPLFLLVLGFTTIISYFCAGIKCAEFLSPKIGRKAYYVFTSFYTLIFVCFETTQALTVMSITAALLLLLNLYGIYKLSHEIGFNIPSRKKEEARAQATPTLREAKDPVLEQISS